MTYFVYNIENDKEHLVVTIEGSYDSVKRFIANNRFIFRDGYKIYEKRFVEDGKA